MCASENVTNNFKKQMGCIIDLSVGLNLDGTCRDHTVLNYDETRCLPEFAERSTSTGIRINADPLYKFTQYKIDDGDQQLNEILMKQLLEEQERVRIVQQAHD